MRLQIRRAQANARATVEALGRRYLRACLTFTAQCDVAVILVASLDFCRYHSLGIKARCFGGACRC